MDEIIVTALEYFSYLEYLVFCTIALGGGTPTPPSSLQKPPIPKSVRDGPERDFWGMEGVYFFVCLLETLYFDNFFTVTELD
jgi:hypothetical protein